MRYEFSNSKTKLPTTELLDLLGNTESLLLFYLKHFDDFNNIQFLRQVKSGMLTKDVAVDTLEETVNSILEITNWFSDKNIHIFRGVELTPDDEEPDLVSPGLCWTWDKDTAENFAEELDSCTNSDSAEYAPCIIEGTTDIENIDWLLTILLNIDEPEEKEIRTYNNISFSEIDYYML